MKALLLPLLMFAAGFAKGAGISEEALRGVLKDQAGAFVLVECASGRVLVSDAAACDEKVAPCSTFKIWNSAIGLETGLVKDPDAPFWKWDGERRAIEGWNQDQTLRTAIAVSCVPAYQELARKIGPRVMQEWIDRIGYGDRNTAAGIDVFWLPKPDRKTLLISPKQQAELLAKLVRGEMPFSPATCAVLENIMTLKTTGNGTFYGKTGTGSYGEGRDLIGWFVGYVKSSEGTFTFACLMKGQRVMGKDARAATEHVLGALKLL